MVTGLIAQYPIGGLAWDYLQYAVGLQRLGHDVYYIEDTGQWPYDPESGGLVGDGGANARYLHGVMDRFGLGERWAYRSPTGPTWYGLTSSLRDDVMRNAGIVLNVSGVLQDLEPYGDDTTLVYVDSDPVFTQIKMARGQQDFEAHVRAHDRHFTFGETLRDSDVPDGRLTWQPTRQPIVLDEWANGLDPGDRFTTVMNWVSYNPVRHDGVDYGQKDVELRRFVDLPASVPDLDLELALGVGRARAAPVDLLRHRGWKVVDPDAVCPDLDTYRDYLIGSRGEWSIAKNGYVVGQAGWFSCRTACYLAAGRPAIVQDTGFSATIPTGEGLLTFADLSEAAEALREVDGAIARHSLAARSLAAEYFDSSVVLGSLIERAAGSEDRHVG